MRAALPLSGSLALAESLLGQAGPRYGLGLSIERGGAGLIDLPGLDAGSDAVLDRGTLEVLATLYFVCELEGTHLVSVAEELAAHRFGLNLPDVSAARSLEELATRMRTGWVDRETRNRIALRVFGAGFVDTGIGDAQVNQSFDSLMARFCASLVHAFRGGRFARDRGELVVVAHAGMALARNLASRAQGNTLLVSRRLVEQLQLCIVALNQPALAQLFMGRTLWDVLRGVLGSDAPDLERHVALAQSGMRVMAWLAEALDAVRQKDPRQIATRIAAEPSLVAFATAWLDAAGAGQGKGLDGVQGRTLH